MGRPLRAIDEGLVYHALNRGNNRAAVFNTEPDCLAFLDSLARAKERYPFQLFGYCLMPNHFHLLIRPEAGQTISKILQSITVAHTARYHKQHGSSGHVWQGRFKSPMIKDDAHLLTVLRYVEANPLRANLIADLAAYRWSSYQHHGLGQDDTLLSPIPEWDELGKSPTERRKRWRARVLSPTPETELASIRTSVSTGLPFGPPDWIGELANRLQLQLTPRPRGRPRKQA